MTPVARHRTAIARTALSKPVRIALSSQVIRKERTVLDYGCGLGTDVALLAEIGISASGWDPVYRPEGPVEPSDVVNLGYVVNVIEDSAERAATLRRAFELAREVLVVAGRVDVDRDGAEVVAFNDGCLTRKNTFQKYYSQSELRGWIESTIGVSAIAAAPGIFFVFKDSASKESYLGARYHTRHAAPKVRKSNRAFEQNEAVLRPLMEFVSERGRIPAERELPTGAELIAVFGSIRRAFALVRRVTGGEQWRDIEVSRRTELLIRLALERFGQRTKFSELPTLMQGDIKSLCTSYSRAMKLADGLLFSIGNRVVLDGEMRSAAIGKLTASALYVHAEALHMLPAALRVYEGCARAFVGVVEAANVVKLHRDAPKVSYLLYPEFESSPHPELSASLLVDLQRCEISYRSYRRDGNPPILHRKEELVDPSCDRRSEWAALTAAEEEAGLFSDTSLIGTRNGWDAALASKHIAIRDGRLVAR